MLRSFIHPLVLGVALTVVAPTAFLAPAYAEDAPAEKSEPTAKPVKGPRLFGIWAKLPSLTAEQKIKIADIHKATVAEVKRLEAQEEADITALLTDEQKLEVQAIKEEAAAKRKTPKKKPEAETETPAGERKEGM